MAPPKFDKSNPEIANLITLFQSTLGYTEAKATEACKNAKNASSLKDLIQQNHLHERPVDDKKGSLLSHLSVQGNNLDNAGKSYIVDAVLDNRLKSTDQVTGMLNPILPCAYA